MQPQQQQPLCHRLRRRQTVIFSDQTRARTRAESAPVEEPREARADQHPQKQRAACRLLLSWSPHVRTHTRNRFVPSVRPSVCSSACANRLLLTNSNTRTRVSSESHRALANKMCCVVLQRAAAATAQIRQIQRNFVCFGGGVLGRARACVCVRACVLCSVNSGGAMSAHIRSANGVQLNPFGAARLQTTRQAREPPTLETID